MLNLRDNSFLLLITPIFQFFGDAEWIGVQDASADSATLPNSNQGSIDQKSIQALATKILEGGKDAFNRRKEKYGFR